MYRTYRAYAWSWRIAALAWRYPSISSISIDWFAGEGAAFSASMSVDTFAGVVVAADSLARRSESDGSLSFSVEGTPIFFQALRTACANLVAHRTRSGHAGVWPSCERCVSVCVLAHGTGAYV